MRPATGSRTNNPITLIAPGTKNGGRSKRYDIYHCVPHEERLYENVKLVGIRIFENKSGSGYIRFSGSYLEIETIFGSRMLISNFGIHLICEHGTKPTFKVFRSWLENT
jgi:hypothetical protein